jgi:hypothetical protein
MGIITLKIIFLLATVLSLVNGFVVPRTTFTASSQRTTRLFVELTDIGEMKAGAMRKELESYGISTKSLLEKSEFVEALKKARSEGKTSVNDSGSTSTSSTTSETATNGESTTNGADSSDSSSESSSSRTERYAEALEKAKAMKVGELKKELTDRGISVTSFFEKTEFVKAYADAVADNKKGSGGGGAKKEEPRDPSYRDVAMQKMQQGTMMGQKVIDVMLR